MLRRTALILLAGTPCLWPADAQLAPDHLPRQEITIANFEATGCILDIGGGYKGTIGRMKPEQVVAIDLSARSLKVAPHTLLKIVMDASDMKFLDGEFQTVTAFFSLLYMEPDVHRKVFLEASRVLQKGGRWLIWDAVVPAVSQEPGGKRFEMYIQAKLPAETFDSGFSVPRRDRVLDPAYYTALAKDCGLEVVTLTQQDSPRKTFFLELRRP